MTSGRASDYSVRSGQAATVSDPRRWLDEHSAELLARPGARMAGLVGPLEEARRTRDFLERLAIRDGRSIQRVIHVGEDTVTLTAEPS